MCVVDRDCDQFDVREESFDLLLLGLRTIAQVIVSTDHSAEEESTTILLKVQGNVPRGLIGGKRELWISDKFFFGPGISMFRGEKWGVDAWHGCELSGNFLLPQLESLLSLRLLAVGELLKSMNKVLRDLPRSLRRST